MNRGTGVLDSAIVTNNDPMVMGMFPPASTGQNQRDSAEASDSLDAAQAAYESITGKKPMSSARPASPATPAAIQRAKLKKTREELQANLEKLKTESERK